MIDTDKYEGHYTEDFDRFWVTADDELNVDVKRANATTNLIDDAPLLLAEVNDLLAEIRQLNNIIGTFDDFMCNNWTPANVHGLWNELLTKEEEE